MKKEEIYTKNDMIIIIVIMIVVLCLSLVATSLDNRKSTDEFYQLGYKYGYTIGQADLLIEFGSAFGCKTIPTQDTIIKRDTIYYIDDDRTIYKLR